MAPCTHKMSLIIDGYSLSRSVVALPALKIPSISTGLLLHNLNISTNSRSNNAESQECAACKAQHKTRTSFLVRLCGTYVRVNFVLFCIYPSFGFALVLVWDGDAFYVHIV